MALLVSCPHAWGDEPLLSSLTADEKQWLSDNSHKVSLWFDAQFPPFEFSDEDGTFLGISADIITLVEKRLGVRFVKKSSSDWSKIIAAFENGRCAVTPTIAKNPERDRYALFTSSYARIPVAIITTQKFGNGITLKDLKQNKIAVGADFATEEYLRRHTGGPFDLLTVANVADGLRAVAFGQADAFVGNLAVASYYISQQGITNLHVAGLTKYDFQFRIGVHKSYPLLFSSIQKAMDTISPEELSRIQNKWIKFKPDEGLSTKTKRTLMAVGLFSALLVLALTCISIILKHRLNEKVSRLHRAQAEIEQSEARFRSFFEDAPLPLAELDMKQKKVLLNQSFTNTFGYSKQDIARIDEWWHLAYPDSDYRKRVREEWKNRISEARQSGLPLEESEYRVTCKNGTVRNVIIKATILGNRLLVTFIDISDLTKAQTDLKKSLERFQTLFNLLPFSCVITDFSGRYLMVNRFFCETLQKSQEAIVGKTMEELGRTIDENDKKRITAEIMRNGEVNGVEGTIRHNGTTSSILFSSRVIDWEEKNAILTATINITDRKNAEAALQKSEERLKVTLDSIGDAVIATDMKGKVTRMNPVAQRLTGWTEPEAEGAPLSQVFDIRNATSKEVIENPVSKVLETGKTIGLANHTMLIARDGNEYQISDSGAPIRKKDGEIIGVVLVFRDVTKEHAIEKQLRQAQKMEAIGTLAGGIAHDFNNILSGIFGYAQLTELNLKKYDKASKYLKQVVNGAKRAADLVQQILTVSRQGDYEKKPIKLYIIVKEAVKLLSASLPSTIAIKEDIRSQGRIMADGTQMHQIVMNLCTNAYSAMRTTGGILAISLSEIKFNESDCIPDINITPGGYLKLEVADSGHGIPPEIIEKIFEPYFTTKEKGEGTGLGLATVLSIVEEHKGQIKVYSEPGEGTAFHVYLPLLEESTGAPDTRKEKSDLQGGTERILLVDDDKSILASTKEYLEIYGYRVSEFSESPEALEAFEKDPGQYDLVITDMTMPEMTGQTLAAKILNIRKDIPVFLCTGFSEMISKDDTMELGIKEYIQKPIEGKKLLSLIRKELNGI